MSLSVRFNVLTMDGQIYCNQSFGTVSYGVDTHDRQVLRDYILDGLIYGKEYYSDNNEVLQTFPWFYDVKYFEINGFLFDIEEFLNEGIASR